MSIRLVESRLEDAAISVFSNCASEPLLSVPTHRGMGTDDMTTPYVTFEATESDPIIIGGIAIGNTDTVLRITLKTHCEDYTRAEHDALDTELQGVFWNPDIATELNDARTDLSCIHAIHGSLSRGREEMHNITQFEMECHVLPNDGGFTITPARVGKAIIG